MSRVLGARPVDAGTLRPDRGYRGAVHRPTQTTVVLAAWGRYAGTELVEAVATLRDQGVPARIVVVDNASDVALPELGPVEILRSDRRVALGAARNLGLAEADTPYIVFWDADDSMLPGTLAFLEESIESDPGLVAFGAAIVESPSGLRHRWPRRWIARLVRRPRLFALADCVWSLFPTTGATIMRTEPVRQSGGFAANESGHDWVLGVSLAFRGRVGWSERPGRIYRIDSQSVLAQHAGARNLLSKARAVRRRLRSDPATPGWMTLALPLIAIAQTTAIGLHVLLRYARPSRLSRHPGTGGQGS